MAAIIKKIAPDRTKFVEVIVILRVAMISTNPNVIWENDGKLAVVGSVRVRRAGKGWAP